jgi:hypothetical protein
MQANAKAAIILRMTGPGWLMVIFVIARSEATMQIQFFVSALDRGESGAHSRDPLARNDEFKFCCYPSYRAATFGLP